MKKIPGNIMEFCQSEKVETLTTMLWGKFVFVEQQIAHEFWKNYWKLQPNLIGHLNGKTQFINQI